MYKKTHIQAKQNITNRRKIYIKTYNTYHTSPYVYNMASYKIESHNTGSYNNDTIYNTTHN